MENYEQKYKEIVERVKELHAAGNFFTKKQMEIIFPQLAESEDERIRKVLVSIVKWLGFDSSFFTDNSVTKSEVLAYLEKQKESGIKWFKSDNLKNPDKPYIDKAGMFYTTDGRMCYVSEIEKQKKQKPVDLVKEEYIENRNDGTFTFDNTEKEPAHNELTIEDIKELDRIYWEIESEMGFEESDAFYKEVLKRFKKYKYGNTKEDTDINGTEG